MDNSKLRSGLKPIQVVDKNGVSRTVYRRVGDDAIDAVVSESLARAKSVQAQRLERCAATASLGLGATIRDADMAAEQIISEIEDNPGLIDDPAKRSAFVSAYGYINRKRSTLADVVRPDKNTLSPAEVRHLSLNDKAAALDDDVDVEALRQNYPEVFEMGTATGRVRAETRLMPQIDAQLDNAVREQSQSAKERQCALDDADRLAERYADAIDSGVELDNVDDGDAQEGYHSGQLSVADVQRKIASLVDPASTLSSRAQSSRLARLQNKMSNNDGSAEVLLFPESKWTVFELHAKFDDWISSTMRSRPHSSQFDPRIAQRNAHAHLVRVQHNRHNRQRMAAQRSAEKIANAQSEKNHEYQQQKAHLSKELAEAHRAEESRRKSISHQQDSTRRDID